MERASLPRLVCFLILFVCFVGVKGDVDQENMDMMDGSNQLSSNLEHPETNNPRYFRSTEKKKQKIKKKKTNGNKNKENSKRKRKQKLGIKDKKNKGNAKPGKRQNKKGTNKKKNKETRKLNIKQKKNKKNVSSQRKTKKSKKGTEDKRKTKKTSENRRKYKLNRKRKQPRRKKTKSKRPKERKKFKQTTPSCRSGSRTVSEQCLSDAMLSLAYEANQVTNYIKQSKRLGNHHTISKNKLTKNGEFASAAKHMLWAIGGNLSDPQCGEKTSDTARQARLNRGKQDSIANYNFLLNCTNSIKEACDINLKNDSYNHDDHSENMTQCNKFKKDFIKVSKECVSAKDQANVTLQCDCWSRAAKDVAIIKKLKCETKSKQKIVTKHKNDCIKAFGKCKKAEDSAIELIHTCMHDHSNELINQTAQSLQEGAEKASRAALRAKLAQIDASYQNIL